jgi:hypothetical protein
MLSNIDLKYSLNRDNNSVKKDDMKYGEKIDAFIGCDSSNSLQKYRSDANVISIKNEVLQLARMRSQTRSISSQLRPDLYRIAFDDPAIDDVFADGDQNSENCVTIVQHVIDDEELDACIDFYGGIIDDENVDLLPSESRQLSPNNQHIYVNQLSLADEVAIAESSSQSFSFNNESQSISKHNKVVDQKKNENNRTLEAEKNLELNEENHEKDYDSVPSHQHLSTAITSDCSENPSQRSHLNDSHTIKRGLNSISLHRFLVDSSNGMHDLPHNSICERICCSLM